MQVHPYLTFDVDTVQAFQFSWRLSAGGKAVMPRQDMFWGAYWARCATASASSGW
jgi:uncharacterized glyoxalase superfamily protein PhnB